MRRRCEKVLTGSAADAFLRHWIDCQAFVGNDLSAYRAPAIVTVSQTPLRHFDANQIALARTLLGFRHRLLLHGIHPRQPPDRLLVERHRCAGLLAQRRHALEIAFLRIKPPARGLQIRFHQAIVDQPGPRHKYPCEQLLKLPRPGYGRRTGGRAVARRERGDE